VWLEFAHPQQEAQAEKFGRNEPYTLGRDATFEFSLLSPGRYKLIFQPAKEDRSSYAERVVCQEGQASDSVIELRDGQHLTNLLFEVPVRLQNSSKP